jgi:hypothetical protein
MNAALRGRKLSPEHRANLSAAMRGRKRKLSLSPEQIVQATINRCRSKFSPEQRAKIIVARMRIAKRRRGRGGVIAAGGTR